MTSSTKRTWTCLALCLTLGLSLSTSSALAGDSPEVIYEAATKAYYEGQKCLSAGRKPGANGFLENEKAIGHLEQAQRLLEQYLGIRPDDSAAERVMVDINSLLFWCHKMSPMVDPEDIEPEDPEELDEDPPEAPPEDDTSAEDEAEAKRKAQEAAVAQKEAAAAQKEADAKVQLEAAREFLAANPKDGMGALSKFFFVAETYPGTKAGAEAKVEADALQEELFAVKPVIPKKPARKALTGKDRKVIEKSLKRWLGNRMKVRCASCGGKGYTICKKCGGTGKLRGMSGRRSTCPKCKRGKVYCKRTACSEGIDTRFLKKVVVDPRAPYYREKIKALLGGHKKALSKFLEALAANLSHSPRAPATISRCANDLGIAPVQLRDIIAAHGPGRSIITPFKSYTVKKIGRKTSFRIKGSTAHEEAVTFEQTPDGKWWLRDID